MPAISPVGSGGTCPTSDVELSIAHCSNQFNTVSLTRGSSYLGFADFMQSTALKI